MGDWEVGIGVIADFTPGPWSLLSYSPGCEQVTSHISCHHDFLTMMLDCILKSSQSEPLSPPVASHWEFGHSRRKVTTLKHMVVLYPL